MPETKKIICKNCNKEFEAPVNSRALFCSDLCKKMYRSEQRKAKRPKGTPGRPKTKTKETTKAVAKTTNKPVTYSPSKEDLLDEIFDPRIWEERPVDIETFLFDKQYLGDSWVDGKGKRTMFPFWQEQAKKMFPLPMKSPYNTIIFSGATGIGKYMPNFCKILTPNGYTTHGEVKIGDEILGVNGRPQRVIGVFPQGKQPTAKIIFNDGSEALAGYEHLWTIQIRHHGRVVEKVLTTQEIIDRYSNNFNKPHSPWLPKIKPIEYSKKSFIVEPYILGALLGDGTIGGNRSRVILTDKYGQVGNEVSKRIEEGYKVIKYSYQGRIDKYKITIKNSGVSPYSSKLKTLGVNHNSYGKHIPEEYFYGSVQQRLDLLRGLMDTDGSASPSTRNKGRSKCHFSSVSKALSEGVVRLARSLGMFATIKEQHRIKTYKGISKEKVSYFVSINSDNFNPFLIERKASIWTPAKQFLNRKFKKIEYYGEEDSTCIKVSNPDEMYLTNDYIPTHNTSVAMGVCCAYYLYIVMCLRDPHSYFDLADQKDIVFAIVNIVTKTMAYKNAWGMLHRMLLRSPWFMARGEKGKGKRPEWTCTTKPISLIYGRGPDDLIGLDILFAFLDEISFYRNKSIEAQINSAKELFNAAWERMKSRYVKFGGIFDGLMCMASSKRTDVSFMESFIKEIMDSQDKDKVFLIDRPRWEILPPESYSGKKFPLAVGDKFRPSQIIKEEEVETFIKAGYKILYPPIENLGEFERDMEKALTNIAGESVGQISSFLRGDLVTGCIDENLVNPFKKSIIYSGFKDPDQYWEYFELNTLSQEDFTLPLFVHLDASLGRDGNSLVGVVTDYAINQKDISGNYQPELHYRELFKVKIRAPQGTETGLDKNTKFIYWLSQRFNLQGVSHDQYQSRGFHQDLARNGIKVVQQSVDAVKDGINPVYAVLKDTMYEKRISLLNDEDQSTELVTLEKYESGKVDKPQGGTDDTAQCLAGAVYLASQAKEEMLSSGTVLLKQLSSSDTTNVLANTPPAEVVASELQKHFSQYSPEVQIASQRSNLRDDWDAFFGKEKPKKEKSDINPTAYWG